MGVGVGGSVMCDHVNYSRLKGLVSVLKRVWVQKGICKAHVIKINVMKQLVMMHGVLCGG